MLSLRAAVEALKQQRYAEAIQMLEPLALNPVAGGDPRDRIQAQVYLVQAYERTGRHEDALSLCGSLTSATNPKVQTWAQQMLSTLEARRPASVGPVEPTTVPVIPPTSSSPPEPAAASRPRAAQGFYLPLTERSQRGGGTVRLVKVGELVPVMGLTLLGEVLLALVLFGWIPVLLRRALFPGLVPILLLLAGVAVLSPWLLDWSVRRLGGGLRWLALTDLSRQSPEASRLLQRLGERRRPTAPWLKGVRLGVVDLSVPLAFSYAGLPGTARLVVSSGLLMALEPDELAAVYAYELGQLATGDCVVISLGMFLAQLPYLLYTGLVALYNRYLQRSWTRWGISLLAAGCYELYHLSLWPLLWLSRRRVHHADHFATAQTGNPNALARALVKIAWGTAQALEPPSDPARANPSLSLLEGIRPLSLCDYRAAQALGQVLRADPPDPQCTERWMVWDLYNHWGRWSELLTSHPLLGKRLGALDGYAQQLALPTQFNLEQVIAWGRRLELQQLGRNWLLPLAIFRGPLLGAGLGLGLGWLLGLLLRDGWLVLGMLPIGIGSGFLLQVNTLYPDVAVERLQRSPDLRSLLLTASAEPLQGLPVQLQGRLVLPQDPGSYPAAWVAFEDDTGRVALRYTAAAGPVASLLLGFPKLRRLAQQPVILRGWFRRGPLPWIDLISVQTAGGEQLRSFHQIWTYGLAGGLTLLGFGILVFVGQF